MTTLDQQRKRAHEAVCEMFAGEPGNVVLEARVHSAINEIGTGPREEYGPKEGWWYCPGCGRPGFEIGEPPVSACYCCKTICNDKCECLRRPGACSLPAETLPSAPPEAAALPEDELAIAWRLRRAYCGGPEDYAPVDWRPSSAWMQVTAVVLADRKAAVGVARPPDWRLQKLECGHFMANWIFLDKESGHGYCGPCRDRAARIKAVEEAATVAKAHVDDRVSFSLDADVLRQSISAILAAAKGEK